MSISVRSFKTLGVAEQQGIVRRDQIGELEYVVAPVVMMVEGVHNNVFYPEKDLSAHPDFWNGRPLIIRHPQSPYGTPTTASRPDLAPKHLGRIHNTAWSDGKLRTEAWFEVGATERNYPGLIDKIEANEPIEVSTGLWSDDELINLRQRPFGE